MNINEKTQNLPRVLSYCGVFLPSEMLHVYRQIAGLKKYEAHVLTRRIRNRDQFPFPYVYELIKHPVPLFRGLRRFYWKTLQKQQVPLSRYQVEQVHRLTDQVAPALIHVYLGTEAVRLIPYLKYETRPKIVSFHGVDTSNALGQKNLEKLLECTDLFLARSESLRSVLIDRGCPPEHVRLNPTGVPVPETIGERKIPNIRGGEPLRLLQACRFIDKKGLDVSIDAIAELRRRGVAVQLDLAGAGSCESALQKQVQKLGLKENVRFLGFLENDKLLMSLSKYHLFLHPSRTTSGNDREGIPNSILEAMACGVPVLSTRHSGIPEAVTHGQNGMLLEAPEAKELAQLVLDAVSDAETYRKLSGNARKTVCEKFSSDHNIDCLEASYDRVLTKGSHE